MPIKIPLYQFETSTAIERHGRAQRTHGTTDPGGVWHPVHRRECLTILLGTYAEKGQCNRPTTNALYSVQPAYACIGSRLCHRSDPQYRLLLKEGVHSFTALIRCAHVLYKSDTGT